MYIKRNRFSMATASAAMMLALAACGGGGGGGSSSGSSSGSTSPTTSNTQTATSANVSTPQYAAGSVQLAMFQDVNTARQQCGFPAVVENTTLDTSSANHVTYMLDNGGIATDTEASANKGFTGVTYQDRAVSAGYPSGVGVGGESAGYYTTATLANAAYGQALTEGWIYGVYHSALVAEPFAQIGFGEGQLTYNNFPQVLAANSYSGNTPLTGNLPLTYPCQGTTGVPYAYGGEVPQPPGTTNGTNWGPSIPVAGNVGDTVTLTSGTLTDTSGHVITMKLLDSTSDTNGLLPKYRAVAYSLTALTPNTTYSVSITGTYNGASFSRNYTFSTKS
ncbi:CAP domain-containing protein [Paraburkholderia sp. J8-2]|uniref:CAP domain-containing protein n=1 Tax=Paraburkholderia sp. J8-2 TaxID=2805440 RepID=UPI002AB5E934|nr:CAP domain-containing protein [Paraburkholderia sp. J8-2]